MSSAECWCLHVELKPWFTVPIKAKLYKLSHLSLKLQGGLACNWRTAFWIVLLLLFSLSNWMNPLEAWSCTVILHCVPNMAPICTSMSDECSNSSQFLIFECSNYLKSWSSRSFANSNDGVFDNSNTRVFRKLKFRLFEYSHDSKDRNVRLIEIRTLRCE